MTVPTAALHPNPTFNLNQELALRPCEIRAVGAVGMELELLNGFGVSEGSKEKLEGALEFSVFGLT